MARIAGARVNTVIMTSIFSVELTPSRVVAMGRTLLASGRKELSTEEVSRDDWARTSTAKAIRMTVADNKLKPPCFIIPRNSVAP